jgi:hypothetical protein
MDIEVPVLRLGLAGYTDAQQKAAAEVARAAASARAEWEVAGFAEADGWWLEGSRTVLMPSGLLRVQPGVPSGRSVQIALNDVDRPIAFSQPLTAAGFHPAVTFDLGNRPQSVAVLNQFATWLQNMLSQFCLASSIAEHQPVLGSGSWEVLRGSELLAVVDLRLGAAVVPGATAADFTTATWCIRDHGAVLIPADFARTSVSQLMWQYALRTHRQLLPPHYRHQPLYFRRPPRLAQRQLRDAHLLLLRELAAEPGLNFEQLQQSTGLAEGALCRHLSALYVVGSITANPKRASGGGRSDARDSDPAASSVFTSELEPNAAELRRSDLTAPAPLLPEVHRH